jgi:NADH:ubiquinone oxidoreductase subunit 6 (subunit J)
MQTLLMLVLLFAAFALPTVILHSGGGLVTACPMLSWAVLLACIRNAGLFLSVCAPFALRLADHVVARVQNTCAAFQTSLSARYTRTSQDRLSNLQSGLKGQPRRDDARIVDPGFAFAVMPAAKRAIGLVFVVCPGGPTHAFTMAVLLAVLVVSARSPMHSLMAAVLLSVNCALAMLALSSELLALVSLVVIVGALAVLFLFVVMLVPDAATELRALRSGFSALLFLTAWCCWLPVAPLLPGAFTMHSLAHALYWRHTDLMLFCAVVLTVSLLAVSLIAGAPGLAAVTIIAPFQRSLDASSSCNGVQQPKPQSSLLGGHARRGFSSNALCSRSGPVADIIPNILGRCARALNVAVPQTLPTLRTGAPETVGSVATKWISNPRSVAVKTWCITNAAFVGFKG